MKLALKETLQNLFDRLHIKRIVRYLSGFVAFSVFLLIIVDAMIGYYVRENIYYDIAKIPNRPYGLVLGTSKYFANNALNLFYHNRLLAAQRLFEARKVDYLLLSGDNRTRQYNEPRTMLNDLKRMGVPPEFIYLDFAGFRTLDSVVRADQVFQAHSFTIISQKFLVYCEIPQDRRHLFCRGLSASIFFCSGERVFCPFAGGVGFNGGKRTALFGGTGAASPTGYYS